MNFLWLALLSVTAVAAGAAMAYLARLHPRHHDILEAAGGVMLLAGFALLGYSLEFALGGPRP